MISVVFGFCQDLFKVREKVEIREIQDNNFPDLADAILLFLHISLP